MASDADSGGGPGVIVLLLWIVGGIVVVGLGITQVNDGFGRAFSLFDSDNVQALRVVLFGIAIFAGCVMVVYGCFGLLVKLLTLTSTDTADD